MNDPIKILYAEDDRSIRELTEMVLEDEGYILTMCETGLVALEKGRECGADLLLLDVMMPGIDGPTTLRKLREIPHLTATPAIFMTAKVQPNEIAQYKAMGAVGVICKPYDPMTLADDIRGYLNSNP